MPGGAKIAPAELFASALATIQTNTHPRRLPWWAEWSFVIVVALAALWIPRSKATVLAITVIVLEGALICAAILLYQSRALVLPGVLPLGLAVWILILRVIAKKAQRVIAF